MDARREMAGRRRVMAVWKRVWGLMSGRKSKTNESTEEIRIMVPHTTSATVGRISNDAGHMGRWYSCPRLVELYADKVSAVTAMIMRPEIEARVRRARRVCVVRVRRRWVLVGIMGDEVVLSSWKCEVKPAFARDWSAIFENVEVDKDSIWFTHWRWKQEWKESVDDIR